jgi:hypothetical protein
MMRASVMTRPAGVGASLDDLLASRFLPSRSATRIRCAGDLPTRLERCAKNLMSNSEWRAYGDEDRIFFAIARAHLTDERSDAVAAIDVFFLDDNAAVYSAGVWEYDRKHGWWLDSVLDLSYDCEHGWWLDVLMDPPMSIDRAAVSVRVSVVAPPCLVGTVAQKRAARPRRAHA